MFEDRNLKKWAKKYLLSFVGIPYKWGGNNPIEGFDCSGLALEFINAFYGKLADTTAQGILNTFGQAKVDKPEFGTLLFYGTKEAITHIAIALDKNIMIEAGGGDSATINPAIAARKNAFVRIRPIDRRNDLIIMCQPNYKWM